MSLDLVAEVWDAMRSHVDLNERKDAADTLVNLLIDLNYEATDIKEAFRDKDVLTALKFYAEQHDDEDEDEDDYQDAEEEWD